MSIPIDGVLLSEEKLEHMFPPDQTVMLTSNLEMLMISIAQKASLIAHELGIKPDKVTVAQLQAWEKSHQS